MDLTCVSVTPERRGWWFITGVTMVTMNMMMIWRMKWRLDGIVIMEWWTYYYAIMPGNNECREDMGHMQDWAHRESRDYLEWYLEHLECLVYGTDCGFRGNWSHIHLPQNHDWNPEEFQAWMPMSVSGPGVLILLVPILRHLILGLLEILIRRHLIPDRRPGVRLLPILRLHFLNYCCLPSAFSCILIDDFETKS